MIEVSTFNGGMAQGKFHMLCVPRVGEWIDIGGQPYRVEAVRYRPITTGAVDANRVMRNVEIHVSSTAPPFPI